jgi:hypothetical protein
MWLGGAAAALVAGVGLYIGITTKPPPPVVDPTPPVAGEIVNVPNLRDLGLERAIETLVVAGLRPGVRHDVARDSRHAVTDHVMKQAPDPDTALPHGERVDIWVWSVKILLPNVIGYDTAKARRSLANLGLVSQTSYSEINGVKPGVVIMQNPEGDTEQADGTRVVLTIAKARAPDSRAPVATLDPKVLAILQRREALLRTSTTVPNPRDSHRIERQP